MPKFTDEWAIDRTLFEYVNNGSCACCGLPALFDPTGIQGLINAVSDLETDAAKAELNAKSPWPHEMRNVVWADRVRLRFKMKKEIHHYQSFFRTHHDNNNDSFKQWMLQSYNGREMKRLFQIPKAEIMERVRTHYNIHSAYGIVLQVIIDQVANISDTGYDMDSCNETAEWEFEESLHFDRRGGFVLKNIVHKDRVTKEYVVNETILVMFIRVFISLGGPKLLHRPSSTTKKTDENDDADGTVDNDDEKKEEQKGPSFRSDRRIVRLLIARYWADRVISKWNASHSNKGEEEVDIMETTTTTTTPSSNGEEVPQTKT